MLGIQGVQGAGCREFRLFRVLGVGCSVVSELGAGCWVFRVFRVLRVLCAGCSGC